MECYVCPVLCLSLFMLCKSMPAQLVNYMMIKNNRTNLEVKFPTIWTDEKAEVGRVREEKRRRRRLEKRKSQKKEDAGARKGRKAAKHYTSPSGMLRILRVHHGVIGSVLKPCKLNPCFYYVPYSPLRSLSIFNGRGLSRRWMHENICRWIFRKINQTRVIWGQVYLYEAKTWD